MGDNKGATSILQGIVIMAAGGAMLYLLYSIFGEFIVLGTIAALLFLDWVFKE